MTDGFALPGEIGLRLGVIRVGLVGADGIGEGETDLPVPVVETAQLRERVPVAARNRIDGGAEEPLSQELRTPDAGELGPPHEVHRGKRLVAEEPHVVLVGVQLDALRAQLGPALERYPDGVFGVNGIVLVRRGIDRPDLPVPEPDPVGIADQRLERILGLADLLFREDQLFLAGRRLRLRLQDVDRRHGPHFHLDLVVAQQVPRQLERLRGDLVAPDGEDEIPVSVLHVAQHVQHAGFELVSRLPLTVLRNHDLAPLRVGAEVLKQGLGDLRVQGAAVARIEGEKGAVRGQAVVVELDKVVGAEGQLLFETQVVVQVVSLVLFRPIELALRRREAFRYVGVQHHLRRVHAPGRREREGRRLPGQPRNLNAQVVLERLLDGVFEAQLERRRLAGGVLLGSTCEGHDRQAQ